MRELMRRCCDNIMIMSTCHMHQILECIKKKKIFNNSTQTRISKFPCFYVGIYIAIASYKRCVNLKTLWSQQTIKYFQQIHWAVALWPNKINVPSNKLASDWKFLWDLITKIDWWSEVMPSLFIHFNIYLDKM